MQFLADNSAVPIAQGWQWIGRMGTRPGTHSQREQDFSGWKKNKRDEKPETEDQEKEGANNNCLRFLLTPLWFSVYIDIIIPSLSCSRHTKTQRTMILAYRPTIGLLRHGRPLLRPVFLTVVSLKEVIVISSIRSCIDLDEQNYIDYNFSSFPFVLMSSLLVQYGSGSQPVVCGPPVVRGQLPGGPPATPKPLSDFKIKIWQQKMLTISLIFWCQTLKINQMVAWNKQYAHVLILYINL